MNLPRRSRSTIDQAAISIGSVRKRGGLPSAQYGQHAIRCPYNRQVRRTLAPMIGHDHHVERGVAAQAQDILGLLELCAGRSLVLVCLTARMPEVLPPCDCRLLRPLG